MPPNKPLPIRRWMIAWMSIWPLPTPTLLLPVLLPNKFVLGIVLSAPLRLPGPAVGAACAGCCIADGPLALPLPGPATLLEGVDESEDGIGGAAVCENGRGVSVNGVGWPGGLRDCWKVFGPVGTTAGSAAA